MRKFILLFATLLIFVASYGGNYNSELSKIDTLIKHRMNRDAIELSKDLYNRAASSGDRVTQLLALRKGITTEYLLDYSSKDRLIDSLFTTKSEFSGDEVSCAVINWTIYELLMTFIRNEKASETRNDIIEETLQQRESLSKISVEPYLQSTPLYKSSNNIASTSLYIALLRNYVGINKIIGSSKLTKRIYEELISLPEMSDELQIAVQLDYIKFMYEDVTEKLEELQQKYSHCDAVVMVLAELIEREVRKEQYKEEQNYEQFDKRCREVKRKYPNSKHLSLIDKIIFDLHRPWGEMSLPGQLYPNVEREVAIEVRNIKELKVELYRLPNGFEPSKEITGVSIYDKNRREMIDSLAKQSSLTQTYKLSFNPKLKQRLQSVVPIKIKELGCYLAVVRDGDGDVLSGETTSVSRIGATTSITSDKLTAYVVDFNSGTPIKKASFDLYIGDKYLYTRKLESSNGLYTVANLSDLKTNTYYTIKVNDGAGDTLSIANSNYNSRYNRSTNDKYSLSCYTDRGAYRPGDTIHIHTVAYSPSKELIKGIHICNRLDFSSGKILSYNHTKTDSWGGASSSIVIPKDVQSGRYRIFAFSNSKDANNYQKANSTQKYIRIESYTQPTSEITLEPMKPIYFPSDSVQLRGLVTGYDGRNMEGVEVHYEVAQEVSYGYYEYETIEKKSVKTNSLGEYKIEFVASEATYEIKARMVDKNGETREAKQWIYIEESPYYLELLTPREMPRSISAPLTFSRNIKSEEPLVWSYTITKDKDDKALFSGEFKDSEPLEIPYDKLKDGVYRIKWSSPQGIGEGSYREFLIYNDANTKKPANDDILFVDVPERKVATGAALRYIVSTAEKEIYAIVTLSRGNELLYSEVKRVEKGTHQYSIDYPFTTTQDVSLNVSTVRGGKRYSKNRTFNIYKPNEAIEVTIEGLQSELKASTANQLRIKVQEQESKRGVKSKLIVTIYDKASDQIKENSLNALKNKEYNWGNISRSMKPYSLKGLWFDFSQGDEKIMIRGMTHPAEFSEDESVVTIGYGASTTENLTGALQTKVRDNFNGTALFSGEIITDENGEAVIPFTLSDLLTTYNVKVVAVASDTRSGTTESEFTATKKVMVSTLLPQFIRLKDTLEFKTMAINRHNYPIEATVEMEQFGTQTKRIYKKEVRQVHLAANSSQSIEWKITAPDNVEELGVRLLLESKSDNDIEQHSLRVDPAVERVRIGSINYIDDLEEAQYIKPHTLLQEGAFNENMTLSYEAILPAILHTIAAQRKHKPTTAIDFANRAYISQATHSLAMRYKLSVLENVRKQERATLPNSEWWIDNLIEMRDHEKAHKEIYLNHYRLDEFRCSDGGFSWLRGGNSSPMITLYIAGVQLGELAIRCSSSPTNDLKKSLEQTMKYLDKVMKSDSTTLNRQKLEYLELRSRQIVNNEPPTPQWNSYLDLIEKKWRNLNTYQMAQAALVLSRSGRDNSELIKIIKQQAVTYPKYGVSFPSGYADNFASIVEGNIAAQTLIMTLLKSTNNDDNMVRDMFKWLMLQRKNQVWVNSATSLEVVSAMYDILSSNIFDKQNRSYIGYPQGMVKSRVLTTSNLDINIVKEGRPIVVKNVEDNKSENKAPSFAILDYSYDVALEDIEANSSGFTVTRELLSSSRPKVGDIVRVRYTIKSDQNINLVKLRTIKCGAYEPRNLKSGYQNGYYRDVRSDGINYYFDLIKRGTTTIEEEFLVWYSGTFTDGYAVAESVMNPHLSGNTTIEQIEIE